MRIREIQPLRPAEITPPWSAKINRWFPNKHIHPVISVAMIVIGLTFRTNLAIMYFARVQIAIRTGLRCGYSPFGYARSIVIASPGYDAARLLIFGDIGSRLPLNICTALPIVSLCAHRASSRPGSIISALLTGRDGQDGSESHKTTTAPPPLAQRP